MKKTSLLFFTALVTAFLGCSSGSKIGVPSGGGTIKGVTERKLANGLTILYFPSDELPSLSLALLLKDGSAQDPEGKAGLARLTADLLDKGTLNHSATEIAAKLGSLGSDFGSVVHQDYALFSAASLSTKAPQLLSIFSDIILKPVFKPDELNRSRSKLLASIAKLSDSPEGFASLAWEKYMFGDHPYGRSSIGTAASLKNIQKRDINRFYLSHYRPNRAYLAVVGKFDSAFKTQLEKTFSEWKALAPSGEKIENPEPIKAEGFRLVSKPGAVQSQIRMGHLTVKKGHPDEMAIRVANSVFGGAFYSRLNHRLRTELGLTYGSYSQFDHRASGGLMTVSTFTKNATTGKAVEEIRALAQKLVAEGVTEKEVESAKAYMRGQFPRSIETPEKLAAQLMLVKRYDLPDTYISQYVQRLDRVSVKDVNRALKEHLKPDQLNLLVFGSPQVAGQIKDFGQAKPVNFNQAL